MALDVKFFPVPSYYSTIKSQSFAVAQNLKGKDLKQIAYNTNYVENNGCYAIPGQSGYFYYNQTGYPLTSSFRFLLIDPPGSFTRYWTLDFQGDQSDGLNPTTVQVSNSFDGITYNAFPPMGYTKVSFTESLKRTTNNSVATLLDTSFTVAQTGAANGIVYGFSVFNQPAVYATPINQANVFGVDVNSCEGNKPVFSAPYLENSSIGGIAKVLSTANSQYYKCIYAFNLPYLFGSVTNWSGSAILGNINVPMFCTNSVSINAFSRLNKNNPITFATANDMTLTSKTCTVYAYGAVNTAGNVGRFEITTSTGNGAITFSSTTPSWQSATLQLQTENLLTYSMNPVHPLMVNGLTGNINFNMRKSTNIDASAFTVWSVQVFEAF